VIDGLRGCDCCSVTRHGAEKPCETRTHARPSGKKSGGAWLTVVRHFKLATRVAVMAVLASSCPCLPAAEPPGLFARVSHASSAGKFPPLPPRQQRVHYRPVPGTAVPWAAVRFPRVGAAGASHSDACCVVQTLPTERFHFRSSARGPRRALQTAHRRHSHTATSPYGVNRATRKPPN
jgi:hypothetical protein